MKAVILARGFGSRISEGSVVHSGTRVYWQPMDTLRDKHVLEELWSSGKAPWKVWDKQPS